MSEHRYTILSTASIPLERLPQIPDEISLQLIPFIEIIPRQDELLKKQINRLATEKMFVIFTSAQAVRLVRNLLNQKPNWVIYCIRYETRVALEDWFGKDYSLNTADNAKALSELILFNKIKEATFFCGDQRLNILPDSLQKKGLTLHELIVYDTRLTPMQIPFQPDAVLFFSPTAVRSYFSMNTLSAATTIFAMGKTTAATLKQFTSLPINISPEADKSFVVNMALGQAASDLIK